MGLACLQHLGKLRLLKQGQFLENWGKVVGRVRVGQTVKCLTYQLKELGVHH